MNHSASRVKTDQNFRHKDGVGRSYYDICRLFEFVDRQLCC